MNVYLNMPIDETTYQYQLRANPFHYKCRKRKTGWQSNRPNGIFRKTKNSSPKHPTDQRPILKEYWNNPEDKSKNLIIVYSFADLIHSHRPVVKKDLGDSGLLTF